MPSGRFVSIRGTPPNRNNVTFNGQVVASAAGTRATALDLVPSEMVSSIEVAKAVLPDMDANALGGSVNVNTLTAFDRAGRFFSASLNALAHQLTTDFGDTQLPFRSSLTAGTRFGANDSWGVVLSGTASRRTFNTAVASPGEWVEVDGVAAPLEFVRVVEDNDRFRYAVNGNLDFRPTPATHAYARLHFSQRDEQFTNTELIFAGDDDPVPTSATQGRLEGFEAQLDISTTEIDEQLSAITLGLDRQLGSSVTLNTYGTFSRGLRDRLTYQPEWGEEQGFSLSYDVGGDFESLSFDDLSAIGNPANYVFTEMDIEFEDLVENTYQLGADLRWDFRSGGNIGFLKAGGQFRLRDKDIDRNEDPWAAFDLPLNLSQFVMTPPGRLQGGADLPITGSVNEFLRFFDQNKAAREYFDLDPIESAEEEVEVDAIVTEDVCAGDLMGNIRVGKLIATGGVRIEATTTTSERYRFVNDDTFENAAISQQEAENDYVDVLPSLHLVYRLSDRFQVRGASLMGSTAAVGRRALVPLRFAAPVGLALIVLIAAAVASCAPVDSDGGDGAASADPSRWVQTAFAVRLDTVPEPSDTTGLTAGDAAKGSAPFTVDADRPFRIRFELEWSEAGPIAGAGEPRFQLQVRRNGEAWQELLARDFPYPDEISTPRVSIVHATTWANGADTGDLLDGSTAPFVGGSAVALDSVTAGGSVEAGVSGPAQTEWEWPVVIRLYADSAVTNAEGDTFEFRMVDAGGHPVAARDGGPAAVQLRVPERLLGGTYVETPGVLGPWQAADGALYFPMEPAETFNVLMTVKSADFGETWLEVDGANRPLTDDLEGFATAMHGGRVYMLHQVSEATYLHAFATTDAAAGADTWVIRDELVAEHSEPPTQVAALVADADGRLTAFYGDSLGLRFRIRSPAGEWGAERRIDGPEGTVASGVMAALGADGRIHVAYTAGNAERRDVWYRSVSASGELGGPLRVATGVGVTDDDIGAVAPLAHLAESGLTVIPYRLDDGYLYTRTVRADGTLTPETRVTDRQVVQSGSDSEQVGVDAIGFDGRVILVVIDEETRDLRTVEGRPDADGSIRWDPSRPLVDDVYAQWLRGRVIRDASGRAVYGIVYDAGSDGGSGMNRFVTLPLG